MPVAPTMPTEQGDGMDGLDMARSPRVVGDGAIFARPRFPVGGLS
jgi:hypothetical protein